jgi:uncharacterized protein (DUF58 family)
MMFAGLEELLALRAEARRLGLTAPRAARTLLAGSHRSTHPGRGMEIEEVRPYAAGDDPRSIDWRVTARRGRMHTKLYREERERPVWLLVDLQDSMFFGSRLQLKSVAAVRAAALLAWATALRGDRIGAVIVAGRATRVLPLRSREAGVLPLLNELIELQPRRPLAGPSRDPAPAGETAALQTLVGLARPGSLVIALSDFNSLSESAKSLWSVLAAHCDCRWFWITDALERQGLPDGRFLAGYGDRIVSIDGANLRSAWRSGWARREAELESCAAAFRIALTPLDAGHNVTATLAAAMRSSKSAA